MDAVALLHRFTLRQLAYFEAAAETGSTVAAAAALHMNQSSLSTALSDLESALGLTLLTRRRGKGLSLTPAGAELLPLARRVLRAADNVTAHADILQGENTGTVHAGCFDIVAPAYLPPIVAAFRAAYPGVQVDLLEGEQSELVAALDEGRVEVALTYDHELPEHYARTVIAEPRTHALLCAGHPLAGASEVALAQLTEDPFILISSSPAKELITQTFSAAGLRPRVVHASSNFDHVRALVHEGLGYALVSQVPGSSPTHWGPGVVALPLAEAGLGHRVVAVSTGTESLSARARNFIATAGAYGERLAGAAGTEA